MNWRETLKTDLGEIEATKDGQGNAWHITHPWGDLFFYGSSYEVKEEMRSIKKRGENQ